MGITQLTMKRCITIILLFSVALAATSFLKYDEQLVSPVGTVLEERNGLVFDAADANNKDMYDNNHSVTESHTEEMEENVEFYSHRALLSTLENFDLESDYDAAFAAAYKSKPQKKVLLGSSSPYTLLDATKEADVFDNTFAVLVYDPSNDNFVGLYSKDHTWRASNAKLFVTMNNLAFLLRELFPERFTPNSPELALAIGSGDYPQVKLAKLPISNGVAPVLMFGSAFRDTNMYPNMIPMPMPEKGHMLCFEEWVVQGKVCRKLKAATNGGVGELVFGEDEGLEWDDLMVR